MGYSEFQIRIFLLPLRLVAKPRLARRAFGSDYRHNVGRLLILTRGESKNRIVSLSGFLFRPPLRLHPARSRRHAQNNGKRNESPKLLRIRSARCVRFRRRTICPVEVAASRGRQGDVIELTARSPNSPPPANRRRGAAVAPFEPHRVQATGGATSACIAIPSAGRRIVVKQRVAPVATGPEPLDRISPMQHGFGAALFLVDLLPAMLPYPG